MRRDLHRPALRRLAVAVALATTSLAPLPGRALDIFTAARPVYVGSWFNGSFTEFQEFQFALDWQGWCNARAGATCEAYNFWNVAGNWDGNAIPNTLSGDARVPAGFTVRVSGFNSRFLGFIPDFSKVNTLSAAGRVEIGTQLSVANATFADLYMFSFARLDTTGTSTVLNLSSGLGEFSGIGGVTQLQGWQPSTLGRLDLLVRSGHALQTANGGTPTPLQIRLEPGARMENIGSLQSGGGSIGLQGTANVATLPVFENSGTLGGSLSLDGVRFNNAGRVQLASSEHLYMGPVGRHTGSFIGGTSSWMSFGGLGGVGHTFEAGSSVSTSGEVFAGRGRHVVLGSWSTARTQVDSGGSLSFDGPAPGITELRATGSGSEAIFNPVVALGRVFVDNGGVVTLNGKNSTIGHLVLDTGRLSQNSLQVTGDFDWYGGVLSGAGPVTLPALTTLHAGSRGMGATVQLAQRLNWEDGSFAFWSGAFTVLPSARFVVAGDFDSAGGGGSLTNFGIVEKTAGTGRASWGMSVNSNGGLTNVFSGVLAWTGGGTHIDPTFSISPGAALELSGGTVFGGTISQKGKVEIVGGSFELLAGTSYAPQSGDRFQVSDLTLRNGARLDLPDPVQISGDLRNSGTLTTGGSLLVGGGFVNDGQFVGGGDVSVYGNLTQAGSFTMPTGRTLYVQGTLNTPTPLTLTDTWLIAGTLNNTSTLRMNGALNGQINQLANTGTLHLVPGAGAALFTIGSGFNAGTLRVDGAVAEVRSGGPFGNSGSIINEGQWTAQGSFLNSGGGSFSNLGTLDIQADFKLAAGSPLLNTGALVVNGGELTIDVGATLTSTGSMRQSSGLTRVNGVLMAAQGFQVDAGVLTGAGRIDGDVTLSPQAIWRPGNSPGTMTVTGSVNGYGRLEIEVESLSVHDRVVAGGSVTLGEVTMLFSAGYAPVDGDVLDWLQAPTGQTTVYNLVTQGLASGFDAQLDTQTGRVEVVDLSAVQIPTSAAYTIAPGALGMNAERDINNPTMVTQLQVDGRLSNRTGALLYASTLTNTGELRNQGSLWTNDWRNDGRLVSAVGSEFSGGRGRNTGQMTLLGRSELGSLENAPGATLELGGTVSSAGTVVNQGTLRVSGRWEAQWQVINNGSFVIEPGAELKVTAPSWMSGFVSQGQAADLVVNGLLEGPNLYVEGRLSGSGTLRGDVTAGYGEIQPGNSPGTLTIDGNLQAPYATLVIELDSLTSFDRLVVSGNAEIGFVRFRLPAGFRPGAGDSFAVLSVGGVLSGPATQGQWFIEAPDPYGNGWMLWAANGLVIDPYQPQPDLRLSFSGGVLSVAVVPEPGGWALMLGGLGAVGAWRRRRQTKPLLAS